jgi:hypothetical protein
LTGSSPCAHVAAGRGLPSPLGSHFRRHCRLGPRDPACRGTRSLRPRPAGSPRPARRVPGDQFLPPARRQVHAPIPQERIHRCLPWPAWAAKHPNASTWPASSHNANQPGGRPMMPAAKSHTVRRGRVDAPGGSRSGGPVDPRDLLPRTQRTARSPESRAPLTWVVRGWCWCFSAAAVSASTRGTQSMIGVRPLFQTPAGQRSVTQMLDLLASADWAALNLLRLPRR